MNEKHKNILLRAAIITIVILTLGSTFYIASLMYSIGIMVGITYLFLINLFLDMQVCKYHKSEGIKEIEALMKEARDLHLDRYCEEIRSAMLMNKENIGGFNNE